MGFFDMVRKAFTSRRKEFKPMRPPLDITQHQAELNNTMIIGSPGSGKSTGLRNTIKEVAEAAEEFIILLDPHGTTADDVISDLIQTYEQRMYVIDLTKPQHMIGLDLAPYSDQAYVGERMNHDKLIIDNLSTIIMRASDRSINLNAAPNTGTWLRRALALRQKQKEPVSLRWAPYALMPGHDLQLHMLANCNDDKLVYDITNDLNKSKNPFHRESMIGAAKRLMEPFFGNPIIDGCLEVAEHTQSDFLRGMKDKMIFIIKSNKLVADDVTRGFMNAILVMTMQFAFREFSRHGKPIRGRIICEEAARLKIGSMEADMMEQGRKAGVGLTLILQHLPEDPDFTPILNCIRRYEIYKQSNIRSAMQLAKEMNAFFYDKMKVKETRKTERILNRGSRQEVVTTESKQYGHDGKERGHTTSQHIVSTPNLETVIDEVNVYESLNEQEMAWLQRIRMLTTGERLVIDGSTASPKPEPVTMLKPPWNSDDERTTYISQALERIWQREPYKTPTYQPPALPMTSAESAKEQETDKSQQWEESEQPTASSKKGIE